MTSPHTTHRSIRTLSIGGATYDVFVRAQASSVEEHHGKRIFALPLGEKIRVDDVVATVGGGASNTSVGLARLGCDAAYCGVIGDDQWGSALMKNFETEGVSSALATMVEGEMTSFSIVLLAKNGERVILTNPGTGTHLHDVTFDRDAAATFDAIILNHIHAESCVIMNDLVAMLQKNPHMHLTWNPGGRQVTAGLKDKDNAALLPLTSLLLLNKEEACELSKTTTIPEALRTLKAICKGIVCITDGQGGSYATDGTQTLHCPILDKIVVDATGAGDAFGTGMTWGVLTGKDLPTCLRAGTINATSVVQVIGAEPGLLTQTQMLSKLAEVSPSLKIETL